MLKFSTSFLPLQDLQQLEGLDLPNSLFKQIEPDSRQAEWEDTGVKQEGQDD